MKPFHVIISLTVVVFTLSLTAGEWSYTTPPSAIKRITVNSDWRSYESIELPITADAPTLASAPILCSFFIETKQDWWFESTKTFDLGTGGRKTFSLNLKDGSMDWKSNGLRRSFGPDVLRWVKCWGIKVFSTSPAKGTLRIGSITFKTIDEQLPVIKPVAHPLTVSVGHLTRPSFYLKKFRSNPFSADIVNAHILISGNGKKKRLPAFYTQQFVQIRSPFETTAHHTPYDLPQWQCIWRPQQAGTYNLMAVVTYKGTTLVEQLEPITVMSDTTAVRKKPGVPASAQFRTAYSGAPIFQHTTLDWVQPSPAVDCRRYIHNQLDWTPEWGNYLGCGEFDQKRAWQLDEWLQATKDQSPMPLLIFSEDELDNQGTYNWTDNPLSRSNSGKLAFPAEFFKDPKARHIIKSRARYLWSRYKHYPQVGGLLLLVNRPQETVVKWIESLASELRQEFPDIKLFCNNPGLPHRSHLAYLDLANHWTTDKRLSRHTYVARNRRQKNIEIEGRYPGSTAIVYNKTIQHWCGAEVFALDILNSEAAGNEVKVMCSLRTDRDTVFQSRLKWLREADWNRVLFSLADASAWTCVDHRQRTLSPWDLLNIKEVALRFFCDHPNEVVLNVRNPHLLYPTNAAIMKRPPIAMTLQHDAVQAVPQYDKFELKLNINRLFKNPYDPNEVTLDLNLVSPSKHTLSQPGFFFEPWALRIATGTEHAEQTGAPHWRIRFTPWEIGTYHWKAVVKAGYETTTITGSFTCTPSKNPGFVRRSVQDKNCFEFSNGDYFYPIGHNLRSPSDRRPGMYSGASLTNADQADRLGTWAYAAWFKKMRMNGENFTRIWMSPWWCGLEWTPRTPGYHGLGYYNQANAARLDKILDMAAENGIYVNLETANHGMLSTEIDTDWEHNPYNSYNTGGFLNHATDFFVSQKAQQLDRQKLRYTIARWGYSPAIAIWGVMTEVEWVEAYYRGFSWVNQSKLPRKPWIPNPYYSTQHRSSIVNWLQTTGDYLKSHDAHPHIVTAHLSNPPHGLEVWQRPSVEVVHNNAYTYFTKIWKKEAFTNSSGVADILYEYDRYFGRISNKPRIIGEWGGHPKKNSERHLQAELHTGLWASAMTNTVGATGYWWWNLIDAHGLYSHFKALSNFVKDDDRRGLKLKTAKARLTMNTHKGDRLWERLGLTLWNRTRLYAYIYPRAMNLYDSSLLATSSNDPQFKSSGTGYLTLPPSTRSGTYTVEYWDTFKGTIIKTNTATISRSNQRIPIPNHRVDLAIKVILTQATAVDDTKTMTFKPEFLQWGKKSGHILRETWLGANEHLSSVKWTTKPAKTEFLKSFEIPYGNNDSYGTRLTAWVNVPVSGRYTFYIAADDEGKLELSKTGRKEGLKTIATIAPWSMYRQWDRFPMQKSRSVYLKKGNVILLRALHAEGTGGDHLSIAWSINKGPITVIPGAHCTAPRARIKQ